jgi:hypothetical protein
MSAQLADLGKRRKLSASPSLPPPRGAEAAEFGHVFAASSNLYTDGDVVANRLGGDELTAPVLLRQALEQRARPATTLPRWTNLRSERRRPGKALAHPGGARRSARRSNSSPASAPPWFYCGTITSLPPLGVCLRSSSVRASIPSDSRTVRATGGSSLPCAAAWGTSSRPFRAYFALLARLFLAPRVAWAPRFL